MSFQAYLDNIEKKTGKTPNDFIKLAKDEGFKPETKAGEIISWLKAEHNLGHGHAMALAHVIMDGAKISDKHVGTGDSHNGESDTLRLNGLKNG